MNTPEVLIIGGGPAGLAAAEVLSAKGVQVLITEAKPSIGRKFLMAGKSGLNLTMDQHDLAFQQAYGAHAAWLSPALTVFGSRQIMRWAEGLGQPVFTGSSDRVFPRSMKGSPLLRAWIARLAAQNVTFQTRWRWIGWQGNAACFETPEGPHYITPRATLMALGGASWARLGSDGRWAEVFAQNGIETSPFKPSNMGFDVRWSAHMAPHFGVPLKPVALHHQGQTVRGECVVTSAGLEGSAVYALSAHLRDAMTATGVDLQLDLAPDRSIAALTAALAKPRGKASLSNHLRKTVRISGVKAAVLREDGPLPGDPAALAQRIKSMTLRLRRARPMDEAISTAGGVARAALTEDFMVRAHPGLFCAGEMLDWDAPTGGYLLTACLATGRYAGHGILTWLDRRP